MALVSQAKEERAKDDAQIAVTDDVSWKTDALVSFFFHVEGSDVVRLPCGSGRNLPSTPDPPSTSSTRDDGNDKVLPSDDSGQSARVQAVHFWIFSYLFFNRTTS